jgi:hypothetical protein
MIITKSWSFDGDHLELTTELVQDACGECFTVNVFHDDDEQMTG